MKKKKANNEIRTRDLSLTKRVLYQLSYIGSVVYCFLKQFLFVSNPSDEIKKMRRPGIEPGPPAWKAGILTTELSTHVIDRI